MAASGSELMGLPVGELRKRLDQQKRLLLNRALLSGLPDGGERVRRKVAELERAISSKQGLEETMEQLSRMHLGEDKGRVEGSEAAARGGEKDGGKMKDGGRRKFVDLQAALGGDVELWDSDDEDEVVRADSEHKPVVKGPDTLPVHKEAEARLGMEPREDMTSDTQLRTDHEKLAAVRQRIQKESPRRAQALNIEESLALQIEQQRREEELKTKSAAQRLMEAVGTMSIGMPPTTGRTQYRESAVSSGQDGEEEEEDGDSVSDPSDLSSGEDDLVGEEIHF